MAEKKLTSKELKAQLAELLNKKAKETDEVKKAELKKQIDILNEQYKKAVKEESAQKNLSDVEKAKKELERLNKLDPNTAGIAPAKAAQEKIIADATKKGLPKPAATPTPTPTVTVTPIETKPKVTTETTTDADKIALAKKEAARTKALGKISSQGVVTSDYAQRNAGIAAADPVGDREAIALGAAAATDFALPETLFNNIPSLKALLEKFVKTPGMTMDAFRKELRNDLWFRQNSDEIKARYVQYYNFRDLQASGRAQGTTDYEMQIAKIEANLKKRAVEIG
jgi:hypothetical protein